MKGGGRGVVFYDVVLQFKVTVDSKTASLIIMQLSSSSFF